MRFNPPDCFMKNLSGLVVKISRNRNRSSSGVVRPSLRENAAVEFQPAHFTVKKFSRRRFRAGKNAHFPAQWFSELPAFLVAVSGTFTSISYGRWFELRDEPPKQALATIIGVVLARAKVNLPLKLPRSGKGICRGFNAILTRGVPDKNAPEASQTCPPIGSFGPPRPLRQRKERSMSPMSEMSDPGGRGTGTSKKKC